MQFNSNGLWSNTTEVVKNLLIINLLMFGAEFALIPIFGDYGVREKLAMFYFGSPLFEPYQVATHMFMHGGLMHLAFNMFALWMFGSLLERIWGPKRFLFFYLFTGLGAAFLHQGFSAFQVFRLSGSVLPPDQVVFSAYELARMYQTPVVGASGAIYGLLMAYGMLFPNTNLYLMFLPVPIKAKHMVIGLIAISVFFGFAQYSGDNIAHFAHLGGMLFGFILLKFWQKRSNTFY